MTDSTDSFGRLMLLHNEALRLCRAISETLRDERLTLISLDSKRLAEILLQKEHLVHSLQNARTKIGDIFTKEFGAETAEAFEALLSAEQLTHWHAAKQNWQLEWSKVVVLGQQNQNFLKHSLKNLGRFADHLKALLGEPTRYSAKGDKVDAPSEARLLEASC